LTEFRTDASAMTNPLGRHAIRVNAVASGIIDAPMLRRGLASQRRSDVWDKLRMPLP
jgi:NAD(P)-dependent dehydrogenase (short-subunit alcohol dehydrogenase family)